MIPSTAIRPGIRVSGRQRSHEAAQIGARRDRCRRGRAPARPCSTSPAAMRRAPRAPRPGSPGASSAPGPDGAPTSAGRRRGAASGSASSAPSRCGSGDPRAPAAAAEDDARERPACCRSPTRRRKLSAPNAMSPVPGSPTRRRNARRCCDRPPGLGERGACEPGARSARRPPTSISAAEPNAHHAVAAAQPGERVRGVGVREQVFDRIDLAGLDDESTHAGGRTRSLLQPRLAA